MHLGVVRGDGGKYKIDVLAKFEALGGASFTVLVECKHQSRPVERDEVMVLESKLRDANAPKAMLFSTSGFQAGAIEFATSKRIATVAIVEGKWLYLTRDARPSPVEPPPWVPIETFVGLCMTKTTNGLSCQAIEVERPCVIDELLSA